MNKKSFLIVALAVLMSASIFAAGSYKVKSVTGKVTYEATPGNWKSVTVGQELSASTVINTSLNSSIILTTDSGDVTIKAMQKGTVDSLTGSNAGVAKSKGLKSSSVQSEVSGKSKGTATASSRASEAKEDIPWDEE